jgi:fido (protein-threonine AMPylation protein)
MHDKYGTGLDAHYCYPNCDVLINKLGLTDRAALEAAEIKGSMPFRVEFDIG